MSIAGCLTRGLPCIEFARPPTHPSSTHPFIQLPVFPPSRPVHPSTRPPVLHLLPQVSVCPSIHHLGILSYDQLSICLLPKQPSLLLSTHRFYSSSQSAIKLPIIHSLIPFPYLSFVISLSFSLSLLSATRLSTCPSACPVYPPSSLIRIPIDPSIPLPSLSSHLCMKTR